MILQPVEAKGATPAERLAYLMDGYRDGSYTTGNMPLRLVLGCADELERLRLPWGKTAPTIGDVLLPSVIRDLDQGLSRYRASLEAEDSVDVLELVLVAGVRSRLEVAAMACWRGCRESQLQEVPTELKGPRAELVADLERCLVHAKSRLIK